MNLSRVATPYIYQRAAARVRRMARSWARADAYVHNVMHVRTCNIPPSPHTFYFIKYARMGSKNYRYD